MIKFGKFRMTIREAHITIPGCVLIDAPEAFFRKLGESKFLSAEAGKKKMKTGDLPLYVVSNKSLLAMGIKQEAGSQSPAPVAVVTTPVEPEVEVAAPVTNAMGTDDLPTKKRGRKKAVVSEE